MEKRLRGTYSPALLEAQKKLESLRFQHQTTLKTAGLLPEDRGRSRFSFPSVVDCTRPSSRHLGPEKTSLTKVLKDSLPQDRIDPTGNGCSNTNWPRQTELHQPFTKIGTNSSPAERCVKLYPDIALGMLRQEVVAAGRLWLLLQYIDAEGCGWVSLSAARRRLTEIDAVLRVCGRRQLRKLLSKGDGFFWIRNDDRIWLKSAAKVAASLKVQRLIGNPVALPVDDLLKGVGHARAHFYASFHSSRNKEARGGKGASPIARSTLQRLSHASRRSQQRYERRTDIYAQSNIALGGVSTIENDQRVAWKQGTAAFRFRDSAGKIGRKGITYSAWQLPNNYTGPHVTLPKGRQKRINRELVDLFTKGMTGNGKISVAFGRGSGRESRPGDQCPNRLYHKHGLSAAASYSRSPDIDAYWPDRQCAVGSYHRWFIISCKEDA
ncbi:MAG: hypothetical protein WA996_26000 [Candidatus Promineifilaceae bacterium]